MKLYATPRYALVSGSYWVANVFLVGYANVAMGFRGLDSFQIGIAFSGAAGIAILFQILSAFLMDRYCKVSVKRTILVIAAVTLVVTVMLGDSGLSGQAVMIFYMIVMGAEISLDSIIYTMAMEIINYGGNVNFGFCRGIGSISYAVVMTVSGYLLGWIGYNRLLLIFFLFQVVFLAAVSIMPDPRSEKYRNGQRKVANDARDEVSCSRKGYVQFLNENRLILVLLLGIAMISMCGNIIENFQIDILREVGGDEKIMGISRGLSAAVEFPVMCSFLMLRRKFQVRHLLIAAMLIYCIRSAMYAFMGSVEGILLAQGVQGIAFSLYNLSSSCFVNESIPREDVAKGQAVIGIAVRGAGGIFANILGGYMIALASAHTALQLCLVLTVISTLIISGVVICAGRNQRATRRTGIC